MGAVLGAGHGSCGVGGGAGGTTETNPDSVTPESLALQHLDQALNDTAFDTGEAERRLADYDKTGRHVGFEEWASDFRMDASSRGQT